MPPLIVVHTLGAAVIHVGNRLVLPTAARGFGALLYLALERDREIPRSEFLELFFARQREPAASHNLRQLTYRLRGLGVPLNARDDTISLPGEYVLDDFSVLAEGDAVDRATVTAVMNGILAGYAPRFSRPFAQWLDERRTAIQSVVTRALVTDLASLRATGRWRELEPVARAALRLDPLNEEATLALAEALALNGEKASALRLLDAYLGEVAPFGKALRLPANVLRSRISERPNERGHHRVGPGPFIGRELELAAVWAHCQHAKGGESQAIVIYGEPGVGKTRLTHEILSAASLDGATTIKVECAAHDVGRPLGVFVDLVPKLLDAPGGLGVAPGALEHLRRLTKAPSPGQAHDGDPQHVFMQIIDAIHDLVDAVCEERPLIILIDDAHSMDPASFDAVVGLVATRRSRRLLFLLTSRTKLPAVGVDRESDRVFWVRVHPLTSSESEMLFGALVRDVGPGGIDTAPVSRSAMAAGNPLYIRWLVTEGPLTDAATIPNSLIGLLKQRVQLLSDVKLRAFIAAVLLAKHCRLDRLVRVAGLKEHELLESIQALESQGYLVADGADIRSSHPMLSQVAMDELPPVTSRLMRSSAAALLEEEAMRALDMAMLWDAAEHWHQAGSTERAVALLSSYAQHCVLIGQPLTACDLLKRALSISQPDERELLLPTLIDAARLSEQYDLVLDAIGRRRKSQGYAQGDVCHDDLEMVEIRAQRFSGTPLPELVPRLRICLSASSADPSHRVQAALQLLIAHDLLLDQSGAIETHRQAQTLTCQSTVDRINRVRANLLFEAFAGDPGEVIRSAQSILGLVEEIRAVPARCSTLADIATSLFRCGACGLGISTMTKAHALACDHGMLPSMIDMSSMLAWMHYIIGDSQNRQFYEATADKHYARKVAATRTSHYLSNKIEFALEREDSAEAAVWLERARIEYCEIEVRRSQLLARAFALRLRQLGVEPSSPQGTLSDLQIEHERGKQCGFHDNFAEAYWFELARVTGEEPANEMLVEYVGRNRRDGYPLHPPIARLVSKHSLAERIDSERRSLPPRCPPKLD